MLTSDLQLLNESFPKQVIVVADTSVLINLSRVGQGGLFQQLF